MNMMLDECEKSGVKVLSPTRFIDERGFLQKHTASANTVTLE